MDKNGKLNRLITETQDLLERIVDEHAPQIQQVRERLQESLEQTKSAIAAAGRPDADASSRPTARVKVRDVAGSLNDYVQSYPWLALATGVLLASSLGILATRVTKRSYRHDS